ncbi:MAG: Crp/Fnr family transcriptional regulator [Bacteroidota bacterium]
MNPLSTYIQSILPKISEDSLAVIEETFQLEERGKGELLLRQGEVCKDLYFLADGICRSYSIKDGNDITTWFSFKDDFITSFTSFFPKEPSYESIEMLNDGTLYRISYEKLIDIRESSREFERMINLFSLQYTVRLEKRLFHLQTQTASEKYQLILSQQPHLVKFIPNKHLASYLGISRETLSRIKSSIS